MELFFCKMRKPKVFIFVHRMVLAAKVTKLDSLTGEVNVHTRKGKTMVLYEMNVKFLWKASVKFPPDAPEEDYECEGEISVPEIEPEDDTFDTSVTLTSKKSDPECKRIRDHIKTVARGILRPLVLQMLNDMKELVAQKQPRANGATPMSPLASAAVDLPAVVAAPTKSIDTKSVTINKDFACPPGEMYECLMDQGRMSMFTQSNCRISREVGGEFTLFGGSVSGTQLELVPGEKIVQSWRFDNWPAGQFSTVTISLNEGGRGCKLSLKQVGVPLDEIERVKFGWENQFWSRIKQCFGY